MTVLELAEQLQQWAVIHGSSQHLSLVLTDSTGGEQFVAVRVEARIGPDGRITCLLVPAVAVGA